MRPAFFQHFDRVTVDWKYLYNREKTALQQESAWIKSQGLKVIADLSSGINLFPDLRIVSNDSAEYLKSMNIIRSVLEKMTLLGAGDLIITTHRTIENNFADEEFSKSVVNTLKAISREAAVRGINLHLRLCPGKFAGLPVQAKDLQLSVDEPNFYIAPSLAMLAGDTETLKKSIESLNELKYSILFIAAPEKDISAKLWNTRLPLFKSKPEVEIKQLLQMARDKILVLDGIYNDKDEEYLEIKNLEELLNQQSDAK
jgi:hypothetical protein